MKKTLLTLMVMCLALAVFSCASTGGSSSSGSTAPAAAAAPTTTGDLGTFRLRMEDNFQWGTSYNGLVQNRNLLGGEQFAVGDKYTLKITYSASRDMEDKMQIVFVDTTEAGNWWTELTVNSDETQIPASKAGEVVSATINFTITAAPSSSAPNANSVVFMTIGEGVVGRAGGGTMKAFNLEFTEFVLTKN